jgi:hypothetical protein
VPDKVIGPGIRQGLHVTAIERRERIANYLDLLVEAELGSGFRHCALL